MAARQPETEDPSRVALREAIRRLRARLGLSQRAFAKKVGVPQSSVYRWEAGIVSPNGNHLKRIHDLARAHGLEASLLADDDESPDAAAPGRDRLTEAALRLMREQLAFCAAVEESREDEVGAQVWEVLGETVQQHRSHLADFLLDASRAGVDDFNLWRALSLLKVFGWRSQAPGEGGPTGYVTPDQLGITPDRFMDLGEGKSRKS